MSKIIKKEINKLIKKENKIINKKRNKIIKDKLYSKRVILLLLLENKF